MSEHHCKVSKFLPCKRTASLVGEHLNCYKIRKNSLVGASLVSEHHCTDDLKHIWIKFQTRIWAWRMDFYESERILLISLTGSVIHPVLCASENGVSLECQIVPHPLKAFVFFSLPPGSRSFWAGTIIKHKWATPRTKFLTGRRGSRGSEMRKATGGR